MRATFHLVPEEVWTGADPAADGVEEVGVTFDRHFVDDARSFLVLTLDLDTLDQSWRYDVPGSPYPHVYGAVSRAAIVAVGRVERDQDGRFMGLSPA